MVGVWISAGILIALFIGAVVAAILIYRDGLKRVKRIQQALTEAQDRLKAQNDHEDEYRALLAQIEDLKRLRDNLEAQVAADQRYLNQALTDKAVAEVQIKSANTQFNEIKEKISELEKVLKERESSVDGEVERYAKEKRGKLEAELVAETEARRREATQLLMAELDALRTEAEARRAARVQSEEEAARLQEVVTRLRTEADALAKCHAEAVRRAAMESGSAGTIHLEQADRDDAALIRKMARGMRCENAVLKATYDVYVKPEVERLVREQGVAGVSGLYRIWKKDGERELSYIGQAVDVGERWKTHAKRAWGVDNTGRIKLYQAMMENGIELWNWELVEACDASLLSEREKYWGNFYAVKEVGLNNKLG